MYHERETTTKTKVLFFIWHEEDGEKIMKRTADLAVVNFACMRTASCKCVTGSAPIDSGIGYVGFRSAVVAVAWG